MSAALSTPVQATLPEEGLDLAAELERYGAWMVDQALIRTLGNENRAAKLLGLKRTTLVEMLERGVGALRSELVQARPESPLMEQATEPELKMVDGVQRVSRASMAKLKAEGLSNQQIADRLGVRVWLIDRALRTPAPLRKCDV